MLSPVLAAVFNTGPPRRKHAGLASVACFRGDGPEPDSCGERAAKACHPPSMVEIVDRGANSGFDFREAHGKSPKEDITKGLFPDKVNPIDTCLYRLLLMTPSSKKSAPPWLFSFDLQIESLA